MKLLNPPEVVTDGGMQITLTHECEVLNIDPRRGAHRRVMKGFLNSEGRFIDWGDHVTDEIDTTELSALTASKPDYKLSDVKARIDTVKAAKVAEAEAKRAEIQPE